MLEALGFQFREVLSGGNLFSLRLNERTREALEEGRPSRAQS